MISHHFCLGITFPYATSFQKTVYSSEMLLHPEHNAVLIVLGRYGAVQLADINDVIQVATLANEHKLHWMLCGFGHSETDSLVKAVSLEGHARIGFENSRENQDGSIAANNSERVKELLEVAGKDFTPASSSELLKVLGQPN